MALSDSDYQNLNHVANMVRHLVKFKSFVQQASNSIETTSEDIVHLVRNIRTLQDVYTTFQNQNIPGSYVVGILGSSKVTELQNLVAALTSLKQTLKTELVSIPIEFSANDGFTYPPLSSPQQTTINNALNSVLSLYE